MSTVEIGGRRLGLTNLDKVLWPDAGVTKSKLIEYYVRVAPVLLPHLEGRPLTLRRFPDGVDGVSWHQNECRGEPEWFHVFETRGVGGRRLRFCLAEDLASLVWLANQAAIELHAFQWRIDAPRRPTTLVFDLDPGPPAELVASARVGLLLRDLLAEVGLVAFPKTSGSLGLHLHVPLGAAHDDEELKAFARAAAATLARRHPDEVVAEMKKERRAAKVFVDWLQNDATRQTVAPYSLRGTPWPLVATPVTWEEVERAAGEGRPELLAFPPDDVIDRIDAQGDLFAHVLDLQQELPTRPRQV
ncbi:MAG TPA: non-homologous end-joining DNA ligase [Gaiellaceae bacterium]|nr:non-homologous end-joining DNA ligase [Gaiellaceae bacterium]